MVFGDKNTSKLLGFEGIFWKLCLPVLYQQSVLSVFNFLKPRNFLWKDTNLVDFQLSTKGMNTTLRSLTKKNWSLPKDIILFLYSK
jgi:hypothetical protein